MNAQELYNQLYGDPENPTPPERRVFSMDSSNGLHEIHDVMVYETPMVDGTETIVVLTEKSEDELRRAGVIPPDIHDASARHKEVNGDVAA